MMICEKDGVTSLDSLRTHLQFAIGLELATIPVYLTGLYSIVEGENTAASSVIQSVVIEEMLHMALAANVLNAIGGMPSTDCVPGIGDPIPAFPATIPFLQSLGVINLQRFSREALATFITIEKPDETCTPPPAEGYSSIGQFYAAIEAGIEQFATDEVFEAAKISRAGCQIQPEEYYGGAGALITVTDKQSALKAIQEIVHQGEGIATTVLTEKACDHGQVDASISVDDGDTLADGWKMYSHYVRFREIQYGRRYQPDQTIKQCPEGAVIPVDWSQVYPMADNPTQEEYQGTPAFESMHAFNQTYTQLINNLYAAFNGQAPASDEQLQKSKPNGIREAVSVMWQLKYQAIALMKTPSPHNHQHTLGAPFQYLRT